MRTVLGIVFGVAAALLIVGAAESIETALYPLPALDNADPATLAGVVADMPLAAKLLIVAGWPIGAFGGAWLGLRVCDRRVAAGIVVAAVMAAALANVLTLPHPVWMIICAVVLPVLGGALAVGVHRKPYRGEALLG
ncbi:hypothetical protein PX554_07455 [Sphingomonas sp. H39-1-10]|uniref:hypothetical protein n=1 Tax=Sphingomonas pollutisoli TaxID=3030829 RepID=UPI0023B9838D|nr:hypothetical protein [Sphingomonas pollutisoli]MDF0487963.1 hypothetical protein [Sphingomonas pollutisoli]